jgi:hypothetical protein
LTSNILALPKDRAAIDVWNAFAIFAEEIGNYELAEKVSRITLALCESLGVDQEVG